MTDEEDNFDNDFNMRCPKCKKTDSIAIVIQAWAMLTSEGTEVYHDDCPDNDHLWDEKSGAQCVACGKTGKVKDFDAKRQDKRRKR